jgi:colicin import membrane protein
VSASLSTSQADFLRPRETDGWRQGLILALVAHGLLVVALMLSMSWRTETREVVEAEVWAEVPVAAAPTAPVMPPEPAPEPPPPVPPLPTPAPAPMPEPIPEPPPVPKAELSVERKPPPKPVKPVKPPKEFFEADPPQVKKRLEQAKPVPKPPEPKPVPPPKPAPTPPAPPAVPAVKKPSPQELARQERERQERLQRMMDDLSGDSLSSAGPSAGYAGRIKARIKPNVVFTEELSGNPLATVEVRCAPDGRIIGRRLLTRSGNQAWDDAVLRAIDRTEVLPLDEKGRIPSVMQIDFRPRDF